MHFPTRSLYPVHEVAGRWDTGEHNIINWAIDGHIALVAIISRAWSGDRELSGLFQIAPEEILALFRTRRRARKASLYRLKADDSTGWIAISRPAEGFTVTAGDILVTRPEMERFEAQSRARSQNAGPGRPARHDWDGFYIALSRHIHDRGLPETQAELVRNMQDWFEARSPGGEGAPDESTIRRKIQRFWQEFHAPDFA